ncbi:MAG TPA: phosphotransferase [Planctomycetaceae bacterium]|nr:phosphotransferase [Planctomycetaceae bacterium]
MSGPRPHPETASSRTPAAPPDTASSGAAGGRTPDTGVESYQPRAADDLPQVFGRYRVIRKLGAGGMGAVYLAHDPHLDSLVALKVPHADCVESDSAVERFYREARAAYALRRVPGVCQVRDVGQVDGRHYLAMDYIEGQPLTAVSRNPDGPRRSWPDHLASIQLGRGAPCEQSWPGRRWRVL